MKQHLEDDDLILHFYGETGAAAEPHLSDCADCRARYQALQRVLNVVDAPPEPYRGPEYESQVWNRLAPKLGQKRRCLMVESAAVGSGVRCGRFAGDRVLRRPCTRPSLPAGRADTCREFAKACCWSRLEIIWNGRRCS